MSGNSIEYLSGPDPEVRPARQVYSAAYSSSWATLAATSDLVRPRTCLRPRLPVAGSVPKLTKPCQPSER
jgi:hypothetical protein